MQNILSQVELISDDVFRLANVRLQAELESNSVAFEQKLQSAAAAAAADREQLRLQIESLDAKHKENVRVLSDFA
jgi:hypothetical protein